MNYLIVSSLLVTSVWFGFVLPNPFCDPNRLRVDSVVYIHVYNSTTGENFTANFYFINDTAVIAVKTFRYYSVFRINDFVTRDKIDTPVDVAYINGTNTMEIIKLKKWSQMYSKWRFNYAEGTVVDKQTLSPRFRKFLTTDTIAVMDVNTTHATVVYNGGAIGVYTMDLMTGLSHNPSYLISDGHQVMLGNYPVTNWTIVSQLYAYEITAAYRELNNVYVFVANRFELRAEVNKSRQFLIETNPLSVKPCQPPDPTQTPTSTSATTEWDPMDDLFTWLPPERRPKWPKHWPTFPPFGTFPPFPPMPPMPTQDPWLQTLGDFIIGLLVLIMFGLMCLPCIIGGIVCGALVFWTTQRPDPYGPSGHVMQQPVRPANTAHKPMVGQSVSANSKEKVIESKAAKTEPKV